MKIFKHTAFAVICMMLFACNNEIDLFLDQEVAQEKEISANLDNGTFVSLIQATEVAEAFFGGQISRKSSSQKYGRRNIYVSL